MFPANCSCGKEGRLFADVDVVLVSTIEPQALAALDAFGAQAYAGTKGTVANALAMYEQGELTPALDSPVL